MEGYNVLIPSVCRQNSPEVVLPVMDALQTLNHTPVVMDMLAIVEMYREMRYRRHGCYELFQFYLRDLFKKYNIDFAFSTGLGIVMEDSQKGETHHLAEECGIPSIILMHVRDTATVKRLHEVGAKDWKHTYIACTSAQLAKEYEGEGFSRIVTILPGTNLRVFFPADAVPENPAFPLRLQDGWLAEGFDVSFAGRWTTQREEMLSALVEAGVKLAIYGDDRWNKSEVLAKYWRNAVPPLDGLNTIYNASKIVLDLPHDHTKLPDYISGRVLDALAAKAFVLTYKRPALSTIADPDREVATFSGTEELISLVRYYLDHEHERLPIAQRGYWRITKEATWDKRLASVLPRLEMHLLAASAV